MEAGGEPAMQDLFNEFKAFLLRGNLIELAVAFVIGGAFAALVTSFVNNLITPIIAMIVGEPDLSYLDFTINDAVFSYGLFLNSLISFVSIAAAVFFFVVKPVNMIMERRKKGEEPAEETPEDIQLLREIRDALRSRA
jgi:large conductance mechanosensitive channel